MSRAQLTVTLIAVALFATLAGCGGSSAESRSPAGDDPRYEDPDFAPEGDLDGDVPTVTLGGYTFNDSSHRIKHPYMYVVPSSKSWMFEGFGDREGEFRLLDFCYGGTVAGVKTVRARDVVFGPAGIMQDEMSWLAYDTDGNIHELKDKGIYPGHSPDLIGVAAGRLPIFVLIKGSALAVGVKWYLEWEDNIDEQYRVMDTNASLFGKTNLLATRWIVDENTDDVFDPSWGGPDARANMYWRPNAGAFALITSASGADGFRRQ